MHDVRLIYPTGPAAPKNYPSRILLLNPSYHCAFSVTHSSTEAMPVETGTRLAAPAASSRSSTTHDRRRGSSTRHAARRPASLPPTAHPLLLSHAQHLDVLRIEGGQLPDALLAALAKQLPVLLPPLVLAAQVLG